MGGFQWWHQGDAVTQGTALLLLAMSVASWMAVLWKLRLWWRVRADLPRALAALWQASSLELAVQRLPAFDREGLVQPLLLAAQIATVSSSETALATQAHRSAQLTRSLRAALQSAVDRLQAGQILLATVGSTAPFVGLLGTVWGIHHALTALTAGGPVTIDRLSGPVGEALVMTAAGLAVAIPAVLAYNLFGRFIARTEAELEGLAHDLHELLAPAEAA